MRTWHKIYRQHPPPPTTTHPTPYPLVISFELEELN